MTTLYDLAFDEDLPGFQARLMALPRLQARTELLHRGVFGWTALHRDELWSGASIELVRAIWDAMKDNPSKTNLFAIASNAGWYPLHCCAAATTSVDVLKFVVDKFPQALVRRSKNGQTPLDYAQNNNPDRANHAAILRCLEESTANYRALLNRLAF